MSTRAESPKHVAIIMDGNGRWARLRGLPRPAGHRASVKVVRKIVEECAQLDMLGMLQPLGAGAVIRDAQPVGVPRRVRPFAVTAVNGLRRIT